MKTRNQTALIKDLEQQIDYLVGYQPSGAHWKLEYHIREQYIEETLASDLLPDGVRTKINTIQEALYNLRNGKPADQTYLTAEEHHTVRVRNTDGSIEYFDLEGRDLPKRW